MYDYYSIVLCTLHLFLQYDTNLCTDEYTSTVPPGIRFLAKLRSWKAWMDNGQVILDRRGFRGYKFFTYVS